MTLMLDLEYELGHGSDLGFDFVAGRVVYLESILDYDLGYGRDFSFDGQKFDHNCGSCSERRLNQSGTLFLVVEPDHDFEFGL